MVKKCKCLQPQLSKSSDKSKREKKILVVISRLGF